VELVVIDDGTGSESPYSEFYEQHNVQYLVFENSGQCVSINRGVESATGDIICLLDSDDLQTFDYLRKVREFFDEFPIVKILYATPLPFRGTENFDNFVASKSEEVLKKSPYGYIGNHSLLCSVPPFGWIGTPTSGISFRREVVEDLFPIWAPPTWAVAADQILCQKVALKEIRAYRTNQIAFHYRVHEGNQYFESKSRVWYETSRRKVLVCAASQFEFRVNLKAAIAPYLEGQGFSKRLVLLFHLTCRMLRYAELKLPKRGAKAR
jgi:glycosyltransferase involved in cell wall biosynthesis